MDQELSNPTTPDNIDALIETSLSGIRKIEAALWAASVPDETLLKQYQTAFRQLEQQIAHKGNDRRHEFIIVIPVADRPRHLKSCLESLLHLCTTFGYGGYADNRFQKVSVIVADDSKETDSIAKHKTIAEECNRQGLTTLYFGLEEQLDQLALLSNEARQALSGIIGNISEKAFYHKGASIMRNIAYLEINNIRSDKGSILFYFIDSDQEFQLKVNSADGEKNIYACNYLFHLDQIFSRTNACILTGKVVGDPPVSPSVMAGNFLEDVISFLHRMAAYDPTQPCRFHDAKQTDVNGASYHDMAALFGFKPNLESCQYQCDISGEHDNASCFRNFSDKLNRFFYGEHPTRKTYYRHEDIMASVIPARTIYTGNFIFKTEALKYFIPFAPLKLRMAGPLLGRLIKAEMDDSFVSANLPMLHNRTVPDTGQSEFRPGIATGRATIDLSGEFERQFYGDVMLFSIEKLCSMGFPVKTIGRSLIAATIAETDADLLQQYNDKHLIILNKLKALRNLFSRPENCWNRLPELAEACANFSAFMDNMEHNFGEQSDAYKLINSGENRLERLAGMIDSIASYKKDRETWAAILSEHVS